ncbi:hypothetical protein M758_5G189800 [Ceratodon purpureus]|nr:hypothetical protein M758_5G189800 [Ceratodon purpureus]
MAAMAGVCVASGVCATLPSLASSCSSQANVVKAAPSSLLVTAAVGSLRPSLRPATSCRNVNRIPTNTKFVRSITHVQASSSHDTEKPVTALPEVQLESDVDGSFFFQRALLTATASLTPFLLSAQDAYAAGGEYGILEGRIFSLIHPVVMLGLFTATGYAGYLGWQWRRVRTIQDEINELKKQVPAVAAEGQAVPSPVDGQIKELSEVRKALIKGGFRDRHFNWGSILLGAGVLFSVSGAVNTYIRTGKLFPGPHLYAGVGITVLWALAAALVPPMQKGNDTARSLHIALNTVNLLLFAWQIPTGWEIVLKVLEFTKFP